MGCAPLIELPEIEEFNHVIKKNYFAVALESQGKRPADERSKLTRGRQLEDAVMEEVSIIGGISFLGVAIINRLLSGGYSVRAIVHNQREEEILKELQESGKILATSNHVAVIPMKTNLTEVGSLMEAFHGCTGVFHTGDFVDPCGLSGYTKSMAEIEVKMTENVLNACSRTGTVRKCLLTSSLLACIWRDGLSPVVDHESWSDESLCQDKRLWYALGKLRSEKTAWRISHDTKLNLATVCSALPVGPDFHTRNSTATLAYLKGAQEMLDRNLLASVDVGRLAEAHVRVFEAMNKTAHGRFLCYDRVLGRPEAEILARQIGMPPGNLSGDTINIPATRIQLSDRKLHILEQSIRNCSDYA